MKKQVVFYGDSNTWGFNPENGGRYPYEKRWVNICANALGETYNCIPEGMNGRTTIFEDPFKGSRNGLEGLDFVLQSHKPIDLFVLMLGTNDLKYVDALGVLSGLKKLIDHIKTVNARFADSYPVFLDMPKILLISPILVTGNLNDNLACDEKMESKKFAGYYRRLAEDEGLFYMDASEITLPSSVDGVHLGLDGHQKLGMAVAKKIQEIFKALDEFMV